MNKTSGQVTLNSDMLKPATPYVNYMHELSKSMSTGANPEVDKAPTYTDDMQIYFQNYADWAHQHPLYLKESFVNWFDINTSWLSEKFPMTKTQQSIVMTHQMILERQLIQISTKKTPARIRHARIESTTTHMVYRSIGFEFDYDHFKSPDGPEAFDRFAAAIYADITAAICLGILVTFQNTPEFYRTPEQRNGNLYCPTTPFDAFRLEEVTFGRVSKSPIGFKQLISQAAACMEREGIQIDSVVVGRTALINQSLGAAAIYNTFAGDGAAAARYDNPGKMLDIRILPIPLLSETIHNATDNLIFNKPVAVGSHAQNLAFTGGIAASSYRHNMRDTSLYSADIDDHVTIPLETSLSYGLQFYPLPRGLTVQQFSEMDPAAYSKNKNYANYQKAGKLNRRLLTALAKRADISKEDNIFAQCKTIGDNNQYDIENYIRFDPKVEASKDNKGVVSKYQPVAVFGELAEENCTTENFGNVIRTGEHAIFGGFDDEQKRDFEAGLQWARELNKLPVYMSSATFNSADTQSSEAWGGAFWIQHPAETLRAVDVKNSKVTHANDSTKGAYMVTPNKHGSIDLPEYIYDIPAVTGTAYNVLSSPYGRGAPFDQLQFNGYGNISGMLTLYDAMMSSRVKRMEIFKPSDVRIITKFIPLYKQVVRNMIACTHDNAAVSPLGVPMYHDGGDKMDDFTRSMITAWYNVFDSFTPPLYFELESKHAPLPAVTIAGGVKDDAALNVLGLNTEAEYDALFLKGSSLLPTGVDGDAVRISTKKYKKIYNDDRIKISKKLKSVYGFSESAAIEYLNVFDAIDRILLYMQAANSKPQILGDKTTREAAYVSNANNICIIPLTSNVRTVAPSAGTDGTDWYYTLAAAGMKQYGIRFARSLGVDVTDGTKDAEITVALTNSKMQHVGSTITYLTGAVKPTAADVRTAFTKTFADFPNKNQLHHVFLRTQCDVSTNNAKTNYRFIMAANPLVYPLATVSDTVYDLEGVTSRQMGYNALPFIDPEFPPQPGLGGDLRGNLLANTKELIHTEWLKDQVLEDEFVGPVFSNMYPAVLEGLGSVNYEFLETKLKHSVLYREEVYNQLADRFKDRLPESIIHSIVYPFNGFDNRPTIGTDRHGDRVNEFEVRWIMSHAMPETFGITSRFFSLQQIDMRAVCAMARKNIEIPLGCILFRPWETAFMRSMVLLGSGKIGDCYASDIDKLISMDKNTKQLYAEANVQHGAAISDPAKFYIMHNAMGGTYLGGKGADFFNDLVELDDVSSINTPCLTALRNFVGDGIAIKSNGIISCPCSYNEAVADRLPVDISLTGYWDVRDFSQRLHNYTGFSKLMSRRMYPGQFFLNMVYNFHIIRATMDPVALDHQSYENISNSRLRSNLHTQQTTAAVWQPNSHGCVGNVSGAATKPKNHRGTIGKKIYKKSFHLWGQQFSGCAAVYQGMNYIGYK